MGTRATLSVCLAHLSDCTEPGYLGPTWNSCLSSGSKNFPPLELLQWESTGRWRLLGAAANGSIQSMVLSNWSINIPAPWPFGWDNYEAWTLYSFPGDCALVTHWENWLTACSWGAVFSGGGGFLFTQYSSLRLPEILTVFEPLSQDLLLWELMWRHVILRKEHKAHYHKTCFDPGSGNYMPRDFGSLTSVALVKLPQFTQIEDRGHPSSSGSLVKPVWEHGGQVAEEGEVPLWCSPGCKPVAQLPPLYLHISPIPLFTIPTQTNCLCAD